MRGAGAAGFVPSFYVFQFHAQDGSLHGIEAAVPSHFFVDVAARAAVIAQAAQVRGHLGIVGGDQSGLAVGAEIFCGIETEGGGHAQAAGAFSVPGGADGLRSIFDHGETKFLGESLERIHSAHWP